MEERRAVEEEIMRKYRERERKEREDREEHERKRDPYGKDPRLSSERGRYTPGYVEVKQAGGVTREEFLKTVEDLQSRSTCYLAPPIFLCIMFIFLICIPAVVLSLLSVVVSRSSGFEGDLDEAQNLLAVIAALSQSIEDFVHHDNNETMDRREVRDEEREYYERYYRGGPGQEKKKRLSPEEIQIIKENLQVLLEEWKTSQEMRQEEGAAERYAKRSNIPGEGSQMMNKKLDMLTTLMSRRREGPSTRGEFGPSPAAVFPEFLEGGVADMLALFHEDYAFRMHCPDVSVIPEFNESSLGDPNFFVDVPFPCVINIMGWQLQVVQFIIEEIFSSR